MPDRTNAKVGFRRVQATHPEVKELHDSVVTLVGDLNARLKSLFDSLASAGATPGDSVVSETAFGQAAAAGSSEDYARADHTHGTPAHADSAGWHFIEEQDAAGLGEVDFDLSTDYDDFIVEIDNFRPSDDATFLYLRVSQDGGGSFLVGASDYAWVSVQTSGSENLARDAADTMISLVDKGSTWSFGNAAGEIHHGEVHLKNVHSSSRKWMHGLGQMWFPSNAFGAWRFSGALLANTNSYNAVRLGISAGTFTSGTFRLFGRQGSA